MSLGTIVISPEWVASVRRALDGVTSAGQAYAAIDTAYSFARDVADEVSGSFLNFDPWRSSASSDLVNAANQVAKLRSRYSEDSEAKVGADWAGDKSKVLYVYNLAQVTRQGYPSGEDTEDIDGILANGANDLVGAILAAPGAVVDYVGDTVEKIADRAGRAGKKVVQAVGGIANEAAAQASDAAQTLIPWRAILLVVGIGTLAVVGIVYMQKAGVGKTIAGVVHP